jgi:hypothetical protein
MTRVIADPTVSMTTQTPTSPRVLFRPRRAGAGLRAPGGFVGGALRGLQAEHERMPIRSSGGFSSGHVAILTEFSFHGNGHGGSVGMSSIPKARWMHHPHAMTLGTFERSIFAREGKPARTGRIAGRARRSGSRLQGGLAHEGWYAPDGFMRKRQTAPKPTL